MANEEKVDAALSARAAEQIRMELARRRISQAQFARDLGAHGQWVWRRLSGETPLILEDLELFADFLDLDPADLFRRSREASA